MKGIKLKEPKTTLTTISGQILSTQKAAAHPELELWWGGAGWGQPALEVELG